MRKKKITLSQTELEIREKLIAASSKGNTVFHADLLDNSTVSQQQLNEMLVNVSEYELNNQRPFISSIVVNKETGYPSPEFYELCDTLDVSDDLEELQNQCFKYWTK